MTLDQTLKQRGNRYGKFSDNAQIAQSLKTFVRAFAGWGALSHDQRECIDMIFAKISRAMTGDPSYADNWVDIAGYAQLVARRLEQENK